MPDGLTVAPIVAPAVSPLLAHGLNFPRPYTLPHSGILSPLMTILWLGLSARVVHFFEVSLPEGLTLRLGLRLVAVAPA